MLFVRLSTPSAEREREREREREKEEEERNILSDYIRQDRPVLRFSNTTAGCLPVVQH